MALRGSRSKLSRAAGRLRAAREELAAAEEQVVFLDEEAADLATRGIVSDSPLDRRTADDAQRTAENARRHRDRLRLEVARLSAETDAMLDQYQTKD